MYRLGIAWLARPACSAAGASAGRVGPLGTSEHAASPMDTAIAANNRLNCMGIFPSSWVLRVNHGPAASRSGGVLGAPGRQESRPRQSGAWHRD
jgi:hypothetical protein